MKDQHLQGFVLSHASVEQLKVNADYLNQYFEQNLWLEDPIEFYTLADVIRLHKKIEQEEAHGKKYVIKIQD